MKYFIDCEFIEGFRKPLFGKRSHFIDLISIGIVCEDGREYYAVSSEFNTDDADEWVSNNVLMPMYQAQSGMFKEHVGFCKFNKTLGKKNKIIAGEIIAFCHSSPEFYGYYSDYDWVLFCSLFGRMIDLPKGFPMYCRDLKQSLDEYTMKVIMSKASPADNGFNRQLDIIKTDPSFPKEKNEHNALSDARWIRQLYEFLNTNNGRI